MARETIKCCTNHGCLARVFPDPPGTLRTNGGCSCPHWISSSRSMVELQRVLQERQQSIRILQEMYDAFSEMEEDEPRANALGRARDFLKRFDR